MKNFNWPLMKDTITFLDKLKMIKFILTSNKFTNGSMVKKFENLWNNWLGSKYSLYVSSGSTANLLLLSSIKEFYNLNDGDKVLVPSCTWVTNIAPVIQVGFEPIFCDINLSNFSFDIDHLTAIKKEHSDIKIIFVTHLLGLDADVELYQKIFPDAIILEDICESHGVKNSNGEKRGSNSIGATFSFYFGHHMTTVEGGMISTNNEELYEIMRLKRSHGLAREGSPKFFEKYKKQYPDLPPSFLFITDGYNFRNHEIPAVLGISQLKRLDSFIKVRQQNFQRYQEILSRNEDLFFIPKNDKSNSSFCFPFVCKKIETYKNLIKIFEKYNVEYRPIVSGNLLKHPFLKKYHCKQQKNVNLIHTQGLYIGNNHFVNKKDLNILESIISEVRSMQK